MQLNVHPKAVVFITEKAGVKTFYTQHRTALDTVDYKRYTVASDMFDDLITLDCVANLWPGLSGFQTGAPNIPAGETIVAQVAFHGTYDIGMGTADSVLVIVKQQAEPKEAIYVFGGGTPAAFMAQYLA